MLGRAQITQPGVQVERRGKVALFSNANAAAEIDVHGGLSYENAQPRRGTNSAILDLLSI